jgi:hypothetical protein
MSWLAALSAAIWVADGVPSIFWTSRCRSATSSAHTDVAFAGSSNSIGASTFIQQREVEVQGGKSSSYFAHAVDRKHCEWSRRSHDCRRGGQRDMVAIMVVNF